MNPLKSDEFPAEWAKYIDTVTSDCLESLRGQLETFPAFLRSIPAGKSEYAYAEGKWNIKEVVGHVLDTERIMAYRVLCFARNDTKELPGFDQDVYVENGYFSSFSLEHYAEEFIQMRTANLMFFESLRDNALLRSGLAGGRLMSVRALLYMIVGHLNHHRTIIQERYL